jgi:hypothetical protein
MSPISDVIRLSMSETTVCNLSLSFAVHEKSILSRQVEDADDDNVEKDMPVPKRNVRQKERHASGDRFHTSPSSWFQRCFLCGRSPGSWIVASLNLPVDAIDSGI